MSFRLHRLHPDDRTSWAAWPIFEERVARFAEPYTKPAIVRNLVQSARERFVHYPDLCGYWLAFQDAGTVAHLFAWIEDAAGSPFVHINQAEFQADAPVEIVGGHKAVVDMVLEELEDWAGRVNELYRANQQPQRIEDVEFWTWRDPTAFIRYLRPREVTAVRTVLRWKIPEMPSVERRVE